MEWEDYINKYKNRFLNIGIVVFCLIIANNIYGIQRRSIDLLKSNIEKENKKNSILGSASQLNKKLKSYKGFLNKKEISLVLDNIGNMAKDSNVKITSVKPEPEQRYPLYMKYSYNLGVSVPDFKTLGKLVSKLESSNDVYMVEFFTVTPRYEEQSEGTFSSLTVNLRVSTFLFKD